MHARKSLASKDTIGTLQQNQHGGESGVDRTTKRLIDKLNKLERVRWNAVREIRSIRTALNIAGIAPREFRRYADIHKGEYAVQQSFASMGLKEACEKVLTDHNGQWLSRSEIEYLVVRGGYPFSTFNSKNSVGITLQRLATDGFCEVERKLGATGNRYRYSL